ncbi:MAG TPA: asparagine synthase-related protein, partial [Dyella sp.]|nr:asparagine synthase-related protein [Dyella sp.]
MNTPFFERSERAPITVAETHLHTSPYAGAVDFSPLDAHIASGASIDPISLADLLRNAFVYPPHTIYRDVKNLATGFAQPQGLDDQPRFHFAHLSTASASRPASDAVSDEALLSTYHELLVHAVQRCTADMKSPWLLQSGGKDSTSLAIAVADVRPDTTCVTYLGGKEENEVESARFVAHRLGLRHEGLVCDPGRAYDRYLAMVPRIPLLTADFAALSYADLVTEVGLRGGDGIIDAIGADQYFGTPVHSKERILSLLARDLDLPQGLFDSKLISSSFKACFALATLQMDRFERYFPGSRFSDAEVDDL